jgi:hypothetical protein
MVLLIVMTSLILMLYDDVSAKFDDFCVFVKFVIFPSSCYNSY